MPVETKTKYRILYAILLLLIAGAGALSYMTRADFLPLPESLNLETLGLNKVQVVDRNYVPLTITYRNRWNLHDYLPLHDIPQFIRQAFVVSEDRRFLRHGGVDWQARLHALWQNLTAMRSVRGASTISEQVVRMWHPRPRTPWSRWLEGWEAADLEKSFSKGEILEFYLNQVPYAGQRRGVAAAARHYFDRDLDTLSTAETLALVVMVRAPSRLNLRKNPGGLDRSILQLAQRLLRQGIIDKGQYAAVRDADLKIKDAVLPVRADHFVNYLHQQQPYQDVSGQGRLQTTLDAGLQHTVQTLLDHRIDDLTHRGARHGAALVVDHQRREVLAWVNSGAHLAQVPASWIDAVTTPRQPGSTLKPLLYALALERGWTAATILDDRPLAEPVGRGLHPYHNYSRAHYGPVRLREALGNSLNIPAVRAIQFVGVADFIDCLHALEIRSLQQHPDYYGDGMALGNGEISLLELVLAYTVLARQGSYRSLKYVMAGESGPPETRRVFSAETAALIGSILSDPAARRLEFGSGSLLRFPVQTAVKTGTSSDYRDAWAVGFNHRYTAGVWIGNLDRRATDGITGSNGPALVLRAVFAELNRHRATRPLYLSPRLIKAEICRDSGLPADGHCDSLSEWFVPGTEPKTEAIPPEKAKPIYLRHPSPGMELALDPRLPTDRQAFMFKIANLPQGHTADWYVDHNWVASTLTGEYLWRLRPGRHSVRTRIWTADPDYYRETGTVNFIVK